MTSEELKKLRIPDSPGVYQFIGAKKDILYVGKATSLRDRVRSYFANDLLHTRGKHVVDMVTIAKTVRFIPTDSVLDAIILEASLIKKHQPLYNSKEKDDKSWNYVVITDEEYPRVLVVRERNIFGRLPTTDYKLKTIFGPFPQGANLKEALKIVRKIFPFRDICTPYHIEHAQMDEIRGAEKAARKTYSYMLTESQRLRNKEVRHLRMFNKPCFNRQIGLCPGVCTGEISTKNYAERIREITLFFSGRKAMLYRHLERMMRTHAKALEFEAAGECKRMIFALRHIKDVALINEEVRSHSQKISGARSKPFRIEAYDVAHISGKYTVGVMTVALDGHAKKSDYRKFKIRPEAIRQGADAAPVAVQLSGTLQGTAGQVLKIGVNDVLHLEQVLRRRFGHAEWASPDLLVIDGGVAQKRRAETVLRKLGKDIPVVSVVKNEYHKPKAILGNKELAISCERGILIANAEAHRFAIAYHRKLRGKLR